MFLCGGKQLQYCGLKVFQIFCVKNSVSFWQTSPTIGIDVCVLCGNSANSALNSGMYALANKHYLFATCHVTCVSCRVTVM